MDVSADQLEAIHQTLFRLERRWVPPVPDASVFFGYEALPMALFLTGIQVAAKATSGRTFLDVGCGIGTKLAFMRTLGYEVAGFDRHGPYIDVARELCPEATLIRADLRDVAWFDADIVYCYRPAVTDELQAMVERHLVERVAPGAVLFLPTRTLDPALGAEHLGDHVWRLPT